MTLCVDGTNNQIGLSAQSRSLPENKEPIHVEKLAKCDNEGVRPDVTVVEFNAVP